MIDWKVLLGEALTQMLRIFLPVALALTLKWLVDVWQKIKAKNPRLAEALSIAAEVGYSAAEEHFRNAKGVDGGEKMLYAIKRAQAYLETLGLNINLEVIRDQIATYGYTYKAFSWTKEQEKKNE